MSFSGWIGVDLDATLAHYDGWKGIDHIGKPVPAILHKMLHMQLSGTVFKIFTARCSVGNPECSEVIQHIQNWTERHGLGRLEVTCAKDFGMIELWDDRCRQVEPNTGRFIDGRP